MNAIKTLQNAKRMFSVKVSQKADYKIVDHVYDAVVVGAGFFYKLYKICICIFFIKLIFF